MGYSLAIDGRCVQRRFAGAAVVMPLCPCVQAEFRALCAECPYGRDDEDRRVGVDGSCT